MSRKYVIVAMIVVLMLIVLGVGVIEFIDYDWFVYPSTKVLNIALNDKTISGIDEQIRDTKFLRNKKVYLNEVTVKTTAKEQETFNTTLELVYSNVFNEHNGEKKFKRYIYEIDLSKKIITKISMNGNAQLSGYEKNLELNDKYTSFNNYIEMVIDNKEIQSKYVNSGEEYEICLLFRHYDRPYKAVVNNKYETTRIPIE